MTAKNNNYDLIIVGAGAAGLAAGIYAGRYRMNVLVLGENFGGETSIAGKIENYPGISSIDGFELMVLMKKQAEGLGARITDERVEKISKKGHCFQVFTGKKSYHADTVILAAGMEYRRLNLPNERELTARGVHYCVTCDGPVYKDKTIAIVGGGDSSVKGTNLAAEYVKKVYLVARGAEIAAEPINYEQMKKLGDRVEVILETEVKELVGKERLEKLILSKSYKGSRELKVDGVFVQIGAIPNVELAKSLGVELDKDGFVKTDNMLRTNVDGVLAAGDIVNLFGRFKQDITAAAMGAVAATSAYEHKKAHGELCDLHAVPGHRD
ncbi:MAG: FAD-dependent oxidoreductase [Parcubacteria group bacterium]|nr:FAD-dependent oxidoreductase [Parcubacteria group bacterium]